MFLRRLYFITVSQAWWKQIDSIHGLFMMGALRAEILKLMEMKVLNMYSFIFSCFENDCM